MNFTFYEIETKTREPVHWQAKKKTQEGRGKQIPFGEMSFTGKKKKTDLDCASDTVQSLENRV